MIKPQLEQCGVIALIGPDKRLTRLGRQDSRNERHLTQCSKIEESLREIVSLTLGTKLVVPRVMDFVGETLPRRSVWVSLHWTALEIFTRLSNEYTLRILRIMSTKRGHVEQVSKEVFCHRERPGGLLFGTQAPFDQTRFRG